VQYNIYLFIYIYIIIYVNFKEHNQKGSLKSIFMQISSQIDQDRHNM